MNVLELIVVATFIIILCFLSIIQSVDIQAATPKGVQTSLCKQYDVIDVPISLCQIASPTDSSNILNGLTDYVKYIIHAHENDHKHNLLQCDSRMIMCDGHIRNLLEWSLKDIPKSKTCTGEIDSKDKIKESNIYFNKFEDKLRSHLLVDDKRMYTRERIAIYHI